MKFWIIPLTAIAAITGLEYLAMLNGINGHVLALAFGGICAIATGGSLHIYSRYRSKKGDFTIKGGKD